MTTPDITIDPVVLKKVTSQLEQWKHLFGDSLQSAYVYGDALREKTLSKFQEINLLLITEEKQDYNSWFKLSEVANRKQKKGFAVPLVLTDEYINTSRDVFPMEYLDMKHFHHALTSTDILDEIEIDDRHLRIQLEREVRGKWVQLRQAVLRAGGNTIAMRNLIISTVSTWLAVFQSIIYLKKRKLPENLVEVLRSGSELAGVNREPFSAAYTFKRERHALNKVKTWELLTQLLEQADVLVKFVDRLEINKGVNDGGTV